MVHLPVIPSLIPNHKEDDSNALFPFFFQTTTEEERNDQTIDPTAAVNFLRHRISALPTHHVFSCSFHAPPLQTKLVPFIRANSCCNSRTTSEPPPSTQIVAHVSALRLYPRIVDTPWASFHNHPISSPLLNKSMHYSPSSAVDMGTYNPWMPARRL